MPNGPDALPKDAPALQEIVRTLLLEHGELHAENDKLRLLVQRLNRHQFGRRLEQLSPDRPQLGLEDLEQTIAANSGRAGRKSPARRQIPLGTRRPQPRRLGAPAMLRDVTDVENRDCRCCGRALVPIGEIRTE